ncbi:cytochrome o ubiquinol oxidase subunit IV [Luteibacter aegosomatis]|uniref:cytochrome o ubiquinol oxidase subunit IV n=1 Tax=Luteibacter aegosomatis TaxID=2911537 RepID=UPI001FF83047|nr:cytochrome o ubiquinol oxidase subunit IV [Luteibacter aegosomatis]UPG85926.1 cytochrome o ubiquinol oxidase subunit IV [Luteibacter aegosomatis]
MSTHVDSHDHHDDHGHHEDDAPHSTLKGYMTGFFLAVVLTAIPFWLVMGKVIPDAQTLAVVLLIFGAIQIVVHMIYFLHMDTKAQGGWNMLALIFTLVLVVITLSGSIWVMYHMNANMMPGMTHDMTQQVKNLP